MPIHYVIAGICKHHALISIVCTAVPYLTILRMHGTIKYKGSKAITEAEALGQLISVQSFDRFAL